MSCQVTICNSIQEFDAAEWNRATKGPFFSHEWFQFAEAMDGLNLQPHYFVSRRQGRLEAALPAFTPRGNQNTYENYLLGRYRQQLLRLAWLRRQPLVCFVPYTGGAYLISDNGYPEEVLQVLISGMEKEAQRGLYSEIVFMCIKECETEWLQVLAKRGYNRVYLNSVGIVRNHFKSFEDYLTRLNKRQRKTVKGDLRAFRKNGLRVDELDSLPQMTDVMMMLISHIDRRYPTIQRFFSKKLLTTCFESMRPYQKHYGVTDGGGPIGCLTHFVKDRLINTYAMGMDFDKAYASRTYFNLLYYHSIQQMIAHNTPYINFNQMAYKVKESRGCMLVPQYMYVKALRNRSWMKFWLWLLDYRYRQKFRLEYGRNQASHRRMTSRPRERR